MRRTYTKLFFKPEEVKIKKKNMYAGIWELYRYQKMYCGFTIMYNECKWWEFKKKKRLKENLDWLYPRMCAELRSQETNNK